MNLKQKVNSTQYVPILSSLRFLLQHEDILGTIFSVQGSSETENIDNFNLLFSTSNHHLIL